MFASFYCCLAFAKKIIEYSLLKLNNKLELGSSY